MATATIVRVNCHELSSRLSRSIVAVATDVGNAPRNLYAGLGEGWLGAADSAAQPCRGRWQAALQAGRIVFGTVFANL